MGRKQKPIDEKLLENLTKVHLNDKTIASILGVSWDTLERRFAEKMDKWRSESKGKIANVLFDEAVNQREPWALKMIAQRHLGYADSVKVEHSGEINKMSDEELEAKIKELQGGLDESSTSLIDVSERGEADEA